MLGQFRRRHLVQPGADKAGDGTPDGIGRDPPIENPGASYRVVKRLAQQVVQLEHLDVALFHFEHEVVMVLLRLVHPDDIVEQ
jgi:hypothetical protein